MLYAQRRDTRIFLFFSLSLSLFTFDSALVSAIYNGREDINAVEANFFFFFWREGEIVGENDAFEHSRMINNF